MTYFKSLLFNFLCVFFVDHIIPGIQIAYYSKLPEIKGDLIFSFALGFINSLIFPALRYLKLKPSHFEIGLISFIISFVAYSIVNLLPVGIKVTTASSFVWASLIVWFGSYLTNHLEFKKYIVEIEDKLCEKEAKSEKEKKCEKEEKKDDLH